MTKKQRICSLTLSMALLASAFLPSALAADSQERGVMTYSEMIAPQYEGAGRFSEGLAPVRKDGKWGFIDETGKTIIPFQYDLAGIFNEGLAIVGITKTVVPYEGADHTKERVELGFVVHTGEFTPFQPDSDGTPRYVDVWDAADGLGVKLSEPVEWIFHNGYVGLNCAYDFYVFRADGSTVLDVNSAIYGDPKVAGPVNEGLIPVWETPLAAGGSYRDVNGNIVKNWVDEGAGDQYISDIRSFNQGLAPVEQSTYDAATGVETELWGFMDRNFNWVIQPQFTNFFVRNINTSYEVFDTTGLAMMEKGGKYGAIDKTGKTVIPFRYEELWPVDDGLRVYKENGKYGYLNADGSVAISPQFVKASGFDNGLAAVYDGSKAFLIDKSGKAIPGGDKLAPSTYFVEHGDGTQTIYRPDEIVVIQNGEKYGFGKVDYLRPLPEQKEMSGWAHQEVVAAIEENLVPSHLQNLYLNNIRREEFSDLIIQAIEETLEQDIKDIVKSKTGKDLYTWIGEYPFQDSSSPNVVAAYALGIVSGRGSGLFDPYASITRQEAAAFLMRSAKVLGMDTSKITASTFSDGDQISVWFKDAVNFVSQINVMSGTGDGFSPQGNYTREQSYLTIYRLFQAATSKS